MPICRKCNDRFPNRLEISPGSFVNAQRRRYCVKCSPFGKHNTARLHDPERYGVTKRSPRHGMRTQCRLCGRKYLYEKEKGHCISVCNSCNANRQRRKRKSMCVEYKGGKCEKCGYSKCLRALGFHHKSRDHKEFGICSMMSMSWARLRRELDKCELLCANCHMEEEDWRITQAARVHP